MEKNSRPDWVTMRISFKSIFFLFILLCAAVVLPCSGRETAFGPAGSEEPAESLRFRRLSRNLSYNTAECIFQDHRGFLWIGTPRGLNRFDGIHIRIYGHDPDDSASLSNDHIRKIAEDAQGDLWIATENGLNRYDRAMDRFVRYHASTDRNSLASNTVSDVWVDQQGRVWAAADDLCLYRPDTDDFARFRPDVAPTRGDPANYHNFIFEDRDGRIWYGRWRELYRLDPRAGRLERVFDGNANPLGNEFWNFQEMIQDASGTFWVATNQAGLQRFGSGPGPIRMRRYSDAIGDNDFLSRYRILALSEDRQGRLWVSMEDNGLAVYDRERRLRHRFKSRRDEEFSVSGNSVWSIFEDRQGRLWFGTWMAGVNCIDPNELKFTRIHSLPGGGLTGGIVTAFLEDKAGNFWIGTDGGGLNHYDRAKRAFRSYRHEPRNPRSLGSNAVLSLATDDAGRLWAGTWNGGVSILDADGKGFTRLNSGNSGLQSNHVFALANDGRGRMAVGTYGGGLMLVNPATGAMTTYQTDPADSTSLQSNIVFSLYRDRKGGLWVGTLSDGLARFREDSGGKGRFTRYMQNPGDTAGLSDNRIHSMFEDEQGRFWVGTSNGLNRLDRGTGRFRNYRGKDGLANDFILAIQGDGKGNLWVSTLGGMTRFNPDAGAFRTFESLGEAPGGQFNLKAVLRNRRGELLFGGVDGFILFHPDSIRANPHPPQIAFTDFRIFNKSVPVGNEGPLRAQIGETTDLTLSYKASVFSFEFTALNLTHPERNQYAFMMEGFEKDWNEVGTQNNATYTNLNPGRYVFRVKAANNDGVWNEEGVSLRIRITPPFWKTWIAFFMYCVFAGGAVMAFIRYRLRRQRMKHELEMEHLQFEKLVEADRMKSRFFSSVSHELRTPIMLILGPLDHLIRTGRMDAAFKGTLEMAARNARRLSRLLNQFIEFYRTEPSDLRLKTEQLDIVRFLQGMYLSFREYAGLHRIDFRFRSTLSYGLTWFDPDALDKIVYNLLSNAFKFTPDGGSVTLSLEYPREDEVAEKAVRIRVADTGVGIPPGRLERLFDRATQAETAPASREQGLGIGLHLAHELVELHQGIMTVESEEGKGTVFTVQLPVDVMVFERPVDREPEPAGNAGLIDLEGAGPDEGPGGETVSSSTEAAKSSHLILVVDDDPDMHRHIQDLFGGSVRMLSAMDGETGFEKAVSAVPDLVISDLEMPGLNGYDLCRRIKTEERTSHIPVLLLTVHSEHENKIKGILIGADDYLPKPFDVKELQARVFNLLESRKNLRAHFRKQILTEPGETSVMSLDERFLERTRQIVENRLSDWKLDADGLSREAGISRTQLYRKLRSLTGQTVHEFIRTVRLKAAARLLENRKMKISEIAYHVGFNDLNYFSRCFRKQFSLSPSEYVASKLNIDLSKTGKTKS
jgi:ligand-binding sensor domain-containing protein/signal transduction histidine kinase/DNA-binding response OmpR family regulator